MFNTYDHITSVMKEKLEVQLINLLSLDKEETKYKLQLSTLCLQKKNLC